MSNYPLATSTWNKEELEQFKQLLMAINLRWVNT